MCHHSMCPDTLSSHLLTWHLSDPVMHHLIALELSHLSAPDMCHASSPVIGRHLSASAMCHLSRRQWGPTAPHTMRRVRMNQMTLMLTSTSLPRRSGSFSGKSSRSERPEHVSRCECTLVMAIMYLAVLRVSNSEHFQLGSPLLAQFDRHAAGSYGIVHGLSPTVSYKKGKQ